MLASAPPVFAYCTDNQPSTPASFGTLFTAGANDADGTAVSCIAAIGHDVHFIRLRIGGVNVNAGDGNAAGDLLVDPAGGTSWSALINDLACGFTQAASNGGALVYEFPIYIAAGSSIGWRCKTVHTVDISSGRICVEAYGEPSRPEMWWCGSGVETLGISDSKGTSVTPGASGAWGSWTSVGSTSARHHKAVQFGVNGSDATSASNLYHFEVGANSQKLPGSGIHWVNTGTSEAAVGRHAPGLISCNVPTGTQYQMRGKASGSGEAYFCAVYGVY